MRREGGPGVVELLNLAGDAAEVQAVLLLLLEEVLAEVETVFGVFVVALLALTVSV